MSTVYFKHLRKFKYKALQNEATIATLITDDGSVNVGLAICSNNDQFAKKTGRELALERAKTSPLMTFAGTSDQVKESAIRGMMAMTGMYVSNEKHWIKKIEQAKNND